MALTTEAIDAIATIRAVDLRRFAQAPPQIKAFLRSATYNELTGQYTRNGQPVPYTEIMALLEIAQQALTRQLETVPPPSGETLGWESAIADILKTGMIIIVLLTFGGAEAIRRNRRAPQIWRTAGDNFREVLGGVSGFGDRIRTDGMTPKQVAAYLAYKARFIRPLNAQLRHETVAAAGYNEARRTLDPTAQHCRGCPGLERPDWVPISEVTPVGVNCPCAGYCRCRVQYRFNPLR